MKRWLQDRRSRSGDLPAHALVGAVIGDLSGPTAVVDERGRVGAIDGSWWIEWGVGAADRWHLAHEEPAVRQSRVGDSPAYETRMRVPGGDIVQRVASANDGGGRTLLVEFENASPDAVAVGLAGRVAGPASIVADAESVSLDGVEWIRAPRPAGGTTAVDGDPWPSVIAGPAPTRVRVHDATAPGGGLVVALPHRQIVQFVVLIEGEFPARPMTPADVAAGWRAVTTDALTIDVPDADLGQAWNRILPDLVVQAGSEDPRAAAEAAWFLGIAGLPREAERAGAEVVARGEFEPVTAAAIAAARVIGSVISVRTAEKIELLPEIPANWYGQAVDVRGCGTVSGRVSFGLRWHGERPALLWERSGGPEAVALTCPALDPEWRTLERTGEVLLAAPTT